MDRSLVCVSTLIVLASLAAASLAWAGWYAITESADLMRRAEEVALLEWREDPYQDRDLTYPPSALPVFATLVAPGSLRATRAVWLGLNLVALAAVIGSVLWLWGRDWPLEWKAAFGLAVAATKPVRLGIGLGQFHLIPLALMLLAMAAIRVRKPFWAGILLGIALTKPTMVLPFLGYLAARREWRALVTAAAWQAAMFGAVSAWLRINPALLLSEWSMNAQGQEAAGIIDVPSLLARAAPQLSVSATQLTLVILSLGLVATWGLRRRPELGLVSLCCVVSAVFTYHRPYDLVLLVPSLAYATDAAWRAQGLAARLKSVVAIAFAVILMVPSHPSAMGASCEIYNPLFTALCYLFLAVVIAYLCLDGTECARRVELLSAGEGRAPMP